MYPSPRVTLSKIYIHKKAESHLGGGFTCQDEEGTCGACGGHVGTWDKLRTAWTEPI